MRYFARLSKTNEILVVFEDQNNKIDCVELTKEQYDRYKELKCRCYLINFEIIPHSDYVPKIKERKRNEVLAIFQNEMANGYIDFTIPSSQTQVQVDARRSGDKNDLQNVEGLIELINLGLIQSPIQYKCYDNQYYQMTLQDLQALKIALMARGLELYAKKHYLEDLIEQAQTKEELEQIRW